MGDWVLVIEGTGQHHNQGDPHDADVLADLAVSLLLEAGQKIKIANFTSGWRLELPVTGTIHALDAQ